LGWFGFDGVVPEHPEHTPSLELYCDGGWVGVHGHRRDRGPNVFDEAMARRIIEYVEESLKDELGMDGAGG